jgi:hypothetical protein
MIRCVADNFYKVIAESLRAVEQLVAVLRPFGRWRHSVQSFYQSLSGCDVCFKTGLNTEMFDKLSSDPGHVLKFLKVPVNSV